MGLTISNGDPRAAQMTGLGGTSAFVSGPDANSTNGAQQVAAIFDRESTALVRFVRGTAGTTNIVVKDADGVDWYIAVNTSGTISANAAAVA